MLFITLICSLFLNNCMLHAFRPIFINKNNDFSLRHINMDCDYYIYKILEIEEKNEISSIIQLSCKKGYYTCYNNFEEDKATYLENLKKHRESQLISKKLPILIYQNKQFLKDEFNKYYNVINDFLYSNGEEWSDIVKITKKEVREKRDL